jgi:anti-sigma factor ChrR (cupin superfamily)
MKEDRTELTALYALGLLEEEECYAIEGAIAQSPDLQAELAEFQIAAAALSYSLPSVVPAASLKDRLFQHIASEIETVGKSGQTPGAALAEAEANLFLKIHADAIPWQPHVVPGVSFRPLYLDNAKREVVAIVRCEPGILYPLHRHAGVEELFVLEGDMVIDGEVYGKGDYIRSAPGSVHAPDTRTGCMFFVRTSLDDEFLDQGFLKAVARA